MCEIARRSMEEVMEQIGGDPIIVFYLKMSQSTEHETSLPLFNETQLRLAIKQIRAHIPIRPNEVQLYSRLLLFYYARKYRSMEQLLSIMTTFSEPEVIDCFDRFTEIRTIWHEFIQKFLLYNMHKDAFMGILYEWSRRFYRKNGQLLRNMLERQAKSVLDYLGWEQNYYKTWLKVFNNKMLYVNLMKDTAELKDVTEADLCTSNIVTDIQHTFSKLMMDFIQPLRKLKYPHCSTPTVAISSMSAQDFLTMSPKVEQQPAPTFVQKCKNSPNTAYSLLVPGNLKKLPPLQEATRCTRTSTTLTSTSKLELPTRTELLPPAAKKSKIEVLKVEILKPELCVLNAAIKKEPAALKNETVVKEIKLENDIKRDVKIEQTEVEELSDIEVSSIDSNEKESVSKRDDDLMRLLTTPPTIPHYEFSKTIDYRCAISSIVALQGYAVHNGHFDALLLLDQVDTIFRAKQKN